MIRVVATDKPGDVRIFVVNDEGAEREIPMVDLQVSKIKATYDGNEPPRLVMEFEIFTFEGHFEEALTEFQSRLRNFVGDPVGDVT